jgi:signal peptidase I
MSPAFEPGHHLLMRRVAGGGGRLGRGDVVIVRDPRDVAKLYLKRMVGLPGEEVRFAGGLLLVDGVHLTEPYLGGLPSAPGLSDGVWTLGSGEYFVMGDNRLRSTDSRDFGPVGVSLVEGKAWFRYWPIRRWGRVSH